MREICTECARFAAALDAGLCSECFGVHYAVSSPRAAPPEMDPIVLAGRLRREHELLLSTMGLVDRLREELAEVRRAARFG